MTNTDAYEMPAEYDLSKFKSRPNPYVKHVKKQVNLDVDESTASEKGQINPKIAEEPQDALGKSSPPAP